MRVSGAFRLAFREPAGRRVASGNSGREAQYFGRYRRYGQRRICPRLVLYIPVRRSNVP
jgi:hypothetical protein